MTLEKLDERADAQAEERELERMQLEAELLEKQRDEKREHEMHMQQMMLSFMQQMMLILTGRSYGHPLHVPTYPVYTAFPNDVPPYLPVTERPITSGNNLFTVLIYKLYYIYLHENLDILLHNCMLI